ncbi:unnamed protein product [Moneuplotes crassus]|uniref:non-specific serine/threonine protein kinase n=1 Tax=Euplotes crassus TaxID=5936 RepID=Q3I4V9_EUPCR|nr:putative calcium-dependant protein kinase [Moneuplotes crassus]CAI2365966.1 unnamed protein product [Moneuplotes crassus]
MGQCNGKSSGAKAPEFKNFDDRSNSSTMSSPTKRSSIFSERRERFILSPGNSDQIKKKYNVSTKALGKGSFGKVVLATNNCDASIKVAIKSLSKKKLNDEMTSKIMDEIKIVQGLDHPNIVSYLETYESDKHIYQVMEYCSGGDLLDRLTNSSDECLEEEEVRKIMKKLFLAINHCHLNGVAHRDLKLENILCKSDDEDEIKIIDFGLSKLQDSSFAEMNTACGSPNYVAPEVISQPSYGRECDIWSLGVIAYLLICGNFPFEGSNVMEVYGNIQQNEVSFEESQWVKSTPACRNFIKRCLTKDKDQRMTSGDALKTNWLSEDLYMKERRLSEEVIDALKNYKASSILKREALSVLVKLLSEDKIIELKEIFKEIDINCTGTISVDELKQSLKEAGIKMKTSQVRKIVQNLDYEENGEINYSEFLAATISLKDTEEADSLLWVLFKHFDIDNSDSITRENISDALLKSGKRISKSDLDMIFKKHDKLKAGEISFEDFKDMLSHLSANPEH